MQRHLTSVRIGALLPLLGCLASPAYALPQADPSTVPAAGGAGSDPSSSTSTLPAPIESTGAESGGSGAVKPAGLAVSLGFGSRFAFIAPDDGGPSGVPGGLFGQIMVGYRFSRFLVGLGFSIGHLGNSATYVAGAHKSTVTRADTSFQFAPTIQIDALRSRDGRVELFGAFQMGLGTTITRRSNDPTIPEAYLPTPDSHNFQLSYQIGPGLRWWARPQFALSLSAGFSGDHIFEKLNTPSGLRSEQYDFVGMYGTIGALGVV